MTHKLNISYQGKILAREAKVRASKEVDWNRGVHLSDLQKSKCLLSILNVNYRRINKVHADVRKFCLVGVEISK